MMNGWITKTAISLLLRVAHTNVIYHFKALESLFDGMI